VTRPLTFAPPVDARTEVDLADYLANRRELPGLFEFAPERTDPDRWASLVRAQADPLADVRLLVADGEASLAAAVDLATQLRRDVYLTPRGARVRYERESSELAGDSWEAVAFDARTGESARWLVVRPADLPATVPSWFVSVRGRLRRSSGLVTLALPDGLMFATRDTFAQAAQIASSLALHPGGLPELSTIAVNADLGRFEIGRYNDAGSLLGGVDFATLVAASLDDLRPDLQLALRWPATTRARAALDDELVRFADALDCTVWVPQPGGSAQPAAGLPGSAAFAAVDQRGEPCHWWAYQSRLAGHRRPRYTTDGAGRLVLALAGAAAGHPVSWLPAAPVTNRDELDLFVWTPAALADADGAWPVPTADLFLLAGEDPQRLAARTRTGHLLRVRAAEASAVDLLEHAPAAPAQVQRRILDLGATRLLPLAASRTATVLGRLQLDGAGGIASTVDVPAAPLAIRFEGAEHGVPGLPNEVVAWPAADQRADTPAYLVLPGAARDGFVALSRTRPEPTPGHQVLEVKVRRRRVVDIAASLPALATAGAGQVAGFDGVDLALPASDLARAVVTKVWSFVDDELALCKLDRGTLADHLLSAGRFADDLAFEELLEGDLAGVR
jgi:hypothetical protein